jgi:hypothetical protein
MGCGGFDWIELARDRTFLNALGSHSRVYKDSGLLFFETPCRFLYSLRRTKGVSCLSVSHYVTYLIHCTRDKGNVKFSVTQEQPNYS